MALSRVTSLLNARILSFDLQRVRNPPEVAAYPPTRTHMWLPTTATTTTHAYTHTHTHNTHTHTPVTQAPTHCQTPTHCCNPHPQPTLDLQS